MTEPTLVVCINITRFLLFCCSLFCIAVFLCQFLMYTFLGWLKHLHKLRINLLWGPWNFFKHKQWGFSNRFFFVWMERKKKCATINIFMFAGRCEAPENNITWRTNAVTQSPTLWAYAANIHWNFKNIDTINLNAKNKFLHFFGRRFFFVSVVCVDWLVWRRALALWHDKSLPYIYLDRLSPTPSLNHFLFLDAKH